MKKLLMILALGAFVACNDSATSTEETSDSLTNRVDSSADAKIDSLESKTDSLTNKIDSSRDAKIDTLQKKD
ncbi:hypothetical protein EXU57_03460 [Segetibacter sp. 3557_3]|uniref:hypothetical protein n=1 Tax=Segetibacter sp. 3557_3 TaxID=2547429 RepID=UPI001058D2ED|nr:hypothetical protein [Segetibacter sp. 3557_3]TDH29137.1 hypothetical protein EXU57_03460 [Segetibacter sp. 3557_3]